MLNFGWKEQCLPSGLLDISKATRSRPRHQTLSLWIFRVYIIICSTSVGWLNFSIMQRAIRHQLFKEIVWHFEKCTYSLPWRLCFPCDVAGAAGEVSTSWAHLQTGLASARYSHRLHAKLVSCWLWLHIHPAEMGVFGKKANKTKISKKVELSL